MRVSGCCLGDLRACSQLNSPFSTRVRACQRRSSPRSNNATRMRVVTLVRVGLGCRDVHSHPIPFQLRDKYDALPSKFPESSQPPHGTIDRLEAFRKRLIYRSKQRGWCVVGAVLATFHQASFIIPVPLQARSGPAVGYLGSAKHSSS